MTLKEVIDKHMNRLKTLDQDKDFNSGLFNLAFVILMLGLVLGFVYSFGITILCFLIYGILAYKSVRW